MKLSKFFRRYSRVLLMVFMSLLLVVFLIGDQLQAYAQRAANPKIKIGTAFGQDVYNVDYAAAHSKLQMLISAGVLPETARIDPMDYYLLTEEARRLGVRVGREQVKKTLMQFMDVEEATARLDLLQQQTGRSYDAIYDTIGEWLAVFQLALLQNYAGGGSLPRAELAFRDREQKADLQLALLDAGAFVGQVPEPTEAELQALFEEGKNRPTEHTEDALFFGYLRPDRVRVEYLTVDPRDLETKVRVREKEVKAYFEEHAANYTKPAPPADTQAAQPARPQRVPMTYEEAQERVRNDARRDRAVREAQGLVEEIRLEVHRAWQGMPRDEQGFRTPPPEGGQLSFEELKARYAERGDLRIVQTGLLSREELARLFDANPELSRQLRIFREPVYVEGQRQVPLSELALRTKGLFEPAKDDPLPVLNLGEPSPVLMTIEQNPATRQRGFYQAYIFRVLEVQPKGPPESLAAVRTELIADCKLTKAYARAGEEAAKLGERAREVGLGVAIEEAADLKAQLEQARQAAEQVGPSEPGAPPPTPPDYVKLLGPTRPPDVTRSTTRVPGLDETEKLPREVFALAEAGGASQPAHPIAVAGVARRLRWAVAELEQVQPLYAGQFEQQRAQWLQPAGTAVAGWLAPENVRQRTQFVAVVGLPTRPEE